MSIHTREELRKDYYVAISTALATYVEAGESVRIHSERQGEELSLTFTFDNADAFHAWLSEELAAAQDHQDGDRPATSPTGFSG